MNDFLSSSTKNYLDDVLVRLAYHSAGIEGNTLSLPATVSIIINATLPLSGKATIREFYEIENHKLAFEHVIEYLSRGQELTVEIIKEIHADLTDRLQYDRGQFKKSENRILGAEFQTASPSETPTFIFQLISNLKYRIEHAKTEKDKLEAILDTHIQFERIHPFSDGNGRTGRMLLNYSLLENEFPPLIIEKNTKAEYIEFLGNQDVDGFLKFAELVLEKEKKRMEDFKNMENEKIDYE